MISVKMMRGASGAESRQVTQRLFCPGVPPNSMCESGWSVKREGEKSERLQRREGRRRVVVVVVEEEEEEVVVEEEWR